MNLNEIAKTLAFKGPTPRPWGAFHIVSLVLTALAVALALLFTRENGEKKMPVIYAITASVMILGEIYKQFVYTFQGLPARYSWYYFPFQFCSTPLYTFTLCAILKKGKIYDCLNAYNATFCIFGALTVFAAPDTVFSSSQSINVQSMLHHAMMLVGGIPALATIADKMSVKLFLKAEAVFLIVLAIAEILNFYLPVWTGWTNPAINFFYIANVPGPAPIQPFKDAYPYPLLVAMYAVVFSEVSMLIAFIGYLLTKVRTRLK